MTDNELHQQELHGCRVSSGIFQTVRRALYGDPLSDTAYTFSPVLCVAVPLLVLSHVQS